MATVSIPAAFKKQKARKDSLLQEFRRTPAAHDLFPVWESLPRECWAKARLIPSFSSRGLKNLRICRKMATQTEDWGNCGFFSSWA